MMREDVAVTSRLLMEPVTRRPIAELALILRNEAVYRYLGGTPSLERFHLGSERAIAGPHAS
jgi:hypothetical protein